jgi:hypothetical protein
MAGQSSWVRPMTSQPDGSGGGGGGGGDDAMTVHEMTDQVQSLILPSAR